MNGHCPLSVGQTDELRETHFTRRLRLEPLFNNIFFKLTEQFLISVHPTTTSYDKVIYPVKHNTHIYMIWYDI
jgi:hypothetical protein